GECRFYFDSFVLDSKIAGIGICGNTGDVCAMPAITATSSGISIGGTIDSINRYTTDGSNPKTSATALNVTGGATTTLALSGPTSIRMYIIANNHRVDSGVTDFYYAG
ncbi:MAG: hypothetical protein LBQ91_00510, partial [Oscillospiraceae bacterium]|nr:hypothetical protein [Oscillospiraceae bacterium]